MEGKKRLKRSKQDVSADGLNRHSNISISNDLTECHMPDDSSDFMGSQECFTVGWDWSGHINGHKKPTIRFIEQPAKKKTVGVQLLECSRQRRLIRSPATDDFDDSVFVKELKSLAAGCKGIPETTSPVASPPSFRRRKEVLVTPTALRESLRKPSCSKSVESLASTSQSSDSFKETTEEGKESLDELLDDSLGADLLKFTQDIEFGLKQNESKTPKPPQKESNLLSSSKRKNRLSLSSKKTSATVQKSVCRRINDVYEENLSSISSRHEPQAKYNNNNVSLKIDFDDMDEAMMLSIGKLEEQEMVKSKGVVSPEKNIVASNEIAEVDGAKLILQEEDDDFVSPDLLDLIDVWEKKATQEGEEKINKEPKLSSAKKLSVTNNLSKKNAILVGTEATKTKVPSKSLPPSNHSFSNLTKENYLHSNLQQPSRKTLCLAKTKTVCTPEEIEKKRQDAKKRLQLKKKCQ